MKVVDHVARNAIAANTNPVDRTDILKSTAEELEQEERECVDNVVPTEGEGQRHEEGVTWWLAVRIRGCQKPAADWHNQPSYFLLVAGTERGAMYKCAPRFDDAKCPRLSIQGI